MPAASTTPAPSSSSNSKSKSTGGATGHDKPIVTIEGGVKRGSTITDTPKMSQEAPAIKPKPEVKSSDRAVMEEQVIRGLEKSKLKRELKETGDYADEGETEIPPEVPKLAFMIGSNVIDCKKLELNDTEARIMADALSILLPKIDSKIYAVIVIVSITGYKLAACKEALQLKMKNLKLGFSMPGSKKTRFDEKRQAVVTEQPKIARKMAIA